MSKDAVDSACSASGIGRGRKSATRHLRLIGSRGYVPLGWEELARRHGLDIKQAKSLHSLYGDEAGKVLAIGRTHGLLDPIHHAHPFIGAEVAFAVRQEMAAHVSDVLLRRLPLGLVNMEHAKEAAPEVARIMGQELGWDEARREQEITEARALLDAWYHGRASGAE